MLIVEHYNAVVNYYYCNGIVSISVCLIVSDCIYIYTREFVVRGLEKVFLGVTPVNLMYAM